MAEFHAFNPVFNLPNTLLQMYKRGNHSSISLETRPHTYNIIQKTKSVYYVSNKIIHSTMHSSATEFNGDHLAAMAYKQLHGQSYTVYKIKQTYVFFGLCRLWEVLPVCPVSLEEPVREIEPKNAEAPSGASRWNIIIIDIVENASKSSTSHTQIICVALLYVKMSSYTLKVLYAVKQFFL